MTGTAAPLLPDAGPADTELSLLHRLRRQDEAACEEFVRGTAAGCSRSRGACSATTRTRATPCRKASCRRSARSSRSTAIAASRPGCTASSSTRPLMKLRTRARRPEESIDDLLPRFLEDGHHVEQSNEWGSADYARSNGTKRACACARPSIDCRSMYRTVLLLRDIEDLSTEEAAQALGVTPNTVKIRLHRARQALAKLLTPAIFTAEWKESRSCGIRKLLHPAAQRIGVDAED